MKIAQIAPVIERVPPKKYGGVERVVYALTEELVKRGHDVTLFATANSITSAKLFPLLPVPLRQSHVKNYSAISNCSRLLGVSLPYIYQKKFDIIHDHNEPLSLPIAHYSLTPVVITVHNEMVSPKIHLLENFNKPYIVSISHAQIPDDIAINHIANVYNGLNMDDYPFSNKPKDYLIFVGRIAPEKGLHTAIAVAKKLQKKLIIAAKLDERDKEYFEKQIRDSLSEQICWIGEVTEKKRNQLMSKALCLLHPIEWKEPFGLTLIEAMACGTPVVAFGKGSIPEIVQHKKTGFVVNTIDEMIMSVKNIFLINRKYCRQYVLSKFNAQRMTDQYELLYQLILRTASNDDTKNFTKLNKINL